MSMPSAVRSVVTLDHDADVSVPAGEKSGTEVQSHLTMVNEGTYLPGNVSAVQVMQEQLAQEFSNLPEPDVGPKYPAKFVLGGVIAFCGVFWLVVAKLIF